MGRKATNAKKLLDYLFEQPVVTAANVSELLAVSPVSTYKIILLYTYAAVLEEMTGFIRSRFFVIKKYLDIFHK